MTKNSMLMQTPYFSVVEGFRQFVRDSVRTEKDHYRWVNLYGEKGLDDPNPKVVEIQDEKAEQLAVACATLAYLTLSVYYGRNKFADTTFAELEGEDYSKFLRQAHYEMTDEHGQFGIFGWDGLITQIAKDCMPDKYVGDNKKASLVYTNMYWSVYNAMKSLKDGKSIRRMIDALLDDGDKIGNLGSSALTILMGDAGTAKTFLSLACGLEQTVGEDPKYRSMLVVRPNVKFDETVGFLKGSEAQKINPLIRPIMDNLDQLTAVNSEDYGTKQGKGGKKSKFATEEAEDKIVAPNSYAQYLFDSGKIEAQAMEYMRGRSIRDRYMIIDEAQNMTPLQAFGIISRAGVGTKIILTGDPNQVDNPLLDSKTNGLTYAANAMKGSKVCTQITFEESECERSELAKEAIKRMKIKGKGRESR